MQPVAKKTPAVTEGKTEQTAAVRPKRGRLQSLDALRGFDMFWIVSGEGIFHGIAAVIKEKYSLQQSATNWQIAVTNQVHPVEQFFVAISNQLHHSVWNGCTFYDIIFPLFIFIAGVSMPFSFSKQWQQPGISRSGIYQSLIRRTVILVLLGMLVNGALQLHGYENTRFASVLGRIALSCFFAALIYLNCRLRMQVAWCALILLGYWVAMITIPVPGFGAGVLTPEGNLAAWVDRMFLPGKLHRKVYDPEGLLSTIPAIGAALLGVFAGQFLQSATNKNKKAFLLMAAGGLLMGLGLLWNLVFPINKNMWTSSFVLYVGGWSAILLAVFYWIIDVRGLAIWSVPLVWIGANSILIYMAAHGIVDFEATSWFIFGGIINQMPPVWHAALVWMGIGLIQLAALFFLYKKRWFLKI